MQAIQPAAPAEAVWRAQIERELLGNIAPFFGIKETTMHELVLSAGWQVSAYTPGQEPQSADWVPAQVPGSVHEALLAAGRIPDPFHGLNERAVQWVGERAWLYRCAFELPADLPAAGPAALCCDGLDTLATVWLNGQQVLSSDNMFVPQRVAVGALLRPGANELRILFEPAPAHGRAQEARHGVREGWNGNSWRVYLRKAQYHFGWDWGPCLITAGPWRPVRLEFGPARIAELHCPVEVAPDLGQAALPVTLRVERSAETPPLEVALRLIDPAGATLDEAVLALEDDRAQHLFSVRSPRLWWPNGHGAQPLYRLEATLRPAGGGAALDRAAQRLGLRRLRLLQEPLADEPGQTFLFEVNNTPIFCGGANWIPADSFVTRLTPERYRAWVALAARGGMNMLRIWGGGIYESDAFYDACDELGLLVWQDFMFACGIYPAHPEFQASVRAEAEAQLRRLRHHPALALWCGNNEDYAIAESLGVYDPDFSGDFTQTAFPARAIYERLLPEVCAALDPTRTYWPGSPYGGRRSSEQTVGDRHTWDVWHGGMAPYQDYARFEGRFVSEFGMQSCPALATLEGCLPPDQRYPQSRAMEFHNKAADGPRRLAVYLNDTLRADDRLDAYVYATQLMQAEALGHAYRVWRRRWAGPGRYAVAGALVWQINDCWPVTSWAIVDYELRAKPAYYRIRRELAPLALGLVHTPAGAEVWAVNATPEPVEAELLLQVLPLEGGAPLREERRAARLPAQQASELGALALEPEAGRLVSARLLCDGEELARALLWPEPLKHYPLPSPGLRVEQLDGDRLRLTVERPAKGVWLDAGDGLAWSDNMLDLLPGQPQTVSAPGLGERPLLVRWLGGAVEL